MTNVLQAESRTLVENVRWETYVALSDDRPGRMPKMAFDQGRLELMSPKKEHETTKTLLGHFIIAFAEKHDLDILSVASTTFRRPDMERGFEADESFYIRHAQTIRSKMEIDLERDPPPELVVEIELTSPVVRKFGILAAIGVPEVWIHNGETLQIHLLGEQDYAASKTSKVLVGFPVAKVDELIRQRHQRGEIELIKEFRHSLLS